MDTVTVINKHTCGEWWKQVHVHHSHHRKCFASPPSLGDSWAFWSGSRPPSASPKAFCICRGFRGFAGRPNCGDLGQADFGGDSSQVQHLLRKPPGLFRALRARRALLVSHFDVRCLKDRSRGTRGTFRGSRIGWVIVVTDLQLWPSNPQEFDTLQYG